ncbi:MAG: GTPase [Bacillati bacterium ANGP1]|uniref:GTPase n=1 Tax=Candidatus Segetimicrobium genomatis TaxID=2569760 RepID=A0A537IWX3_9BACT|nr:MAG: GTPase [Terrabacteria group bacterium ANGP1]
MAKIRARQRGARHARQLARRGRPRSRTRVIILGAGGRDFHNFNVYFRERPEYQVVAFTATQIPDLEGRMYPPLLAGPLYPEGIPIYAEEELAPLVRRLRADQVVFAYSDVSHEHVMHVGSIAMAAGASFVLLGPGATTLVARVPVVSIGAVRTGAGKSQTTRRVTGILKAFGRRIAVIRHPMAYGDLVRQRAQRFATFEDLDRYDVTIEEREEYEPHIAAGTAVYAGVDYREVVRQAQREADVIVWDGGNNDFPFLRSNLHIVIADPHRPGHELTYHPGETNVRMADVVVINKVDTAQPQDVARVRANVARVNPKAVIIEAASPVQVDDPSLLPGRRALVVEDGPTVTHGGMAFGAGVIAARKYGVKEIVDPRPYAVGSIRQVFAAYPHLGSVLPAMGYGGQQTRELQETIAASDCDVVVLGTPVDLRRVITIRKPAVRVRYELQEITKPDLEDVLREWSAKQK